MGAPGRWRAALDAVFGALAALQTSPLPLWKEAADECARLADLQWRFPPRGDSAAELANELRTFGDGVPPTGEAALQTRRYRASTRDAALAASRLASLLTPDRCRVSALLSRVDDKTVGPAFDARRDRYTRVRRVRFLDVDDVDGAPSSTFSGWWRFPLPSPYVSALDAAYDFRVAKGAVERVDASQGLPVIFLDRTPPAPTTNVLQRPSARLVLWLPADRVADRAGKG